MQHVAHKSSPADQWEGKNMEAFLCRLLQYKAYACDDSDTGQHTGCDHPEHNPTVVFSFSGFVFFHCFYCHFLKHSHNFSSSAILSVAQNCGTYRLPHFQGPRPLTLSPKQITHNGKFNTFHCLLPALYACIRGADTLPCAGQRTECLELIECRPGPKFSRRPVID